MRTLLLSILSLLISLCCYAQDSTYQLSDPIDLSEEGWTRVFLLENGNTMLLHFEGKRPITVKIFDTSYQKIVLQKIFCEIIDEADFDSTGLEGIFVIKNEAVIFLSQYAGKTSQLVRLRIDGVSGKLIAEDMLMETTTKAAKDALYFVNRADGIDGYGIFRYDKMHTRPELQFQVVRYRDDHSVKDTVSLQIAGYRPEQIQLGKITASKGVLVAYLRFETQRKDTAKLVAFACLHPQSSGFIVKKIQTKLYQGAYVDRFLYSPFDRQLMFLMISDDTSGFSMPVSDFKWMRYFSVLRERYFLIFDESLNNMQVAGMDDMVLNNYYKELTDTNHYFAARMMQLRTNLYGITTGYFINTLAIMDEAEPQKAKGHTFGHLGIIMYDDKARVIWKKILPRYNVVPATFGSFVLKDNSATLGLVVPEDLWTKKSQYLVMNTPRHLFTDTSLARVDSLHQVSLSDAIYYRIDRKKNVQKRYLFGEPVENEYKHIYAGSGGYYADRQIFVTLMRKNTNGQETIHLAWCKLEE